MVYDFSTFWELEYKGPSMGNVLLVALKMSKRKK